MKKGLFLFIDYGNADQLSWWTKKGSKQCKSKHLDYLVEKDTGKAVGEFVELIGLFANRVSKEGSKFHKNPSEIIIDVKK